MKKTLLILAALLCCCFALKAQDFTIDNLNYSITSTNPPTVALTERSMATPSIILSYLPPYLTEARPTL